MSNRTLDADTIARLAETLRPANLGFAAAHPGESDARQPITVVYGGAQLFAADTALKIGAVALRTLEEHAGNPSMLVSAVGWKATPELAQRVYQRVTSKLEGEAVEDFRIDFEDGYGNRPDAEEDGHAESVAGLVADGMKANTLPPFLGIRIKPLNEELRERSVRTLDLFLTALVRRTGGALPRNFVITVPKVTIAEQVTYICAVLSELEKRLEVRRLNIELMVETPQIIIDQQGRCALPALVAAGQGRVTGAHFGTYDYTAGVGVTASQQRMRHPACDFAKHVMQVSLAGTGVWLSDGSTSVLPVGDRAAVHAAWKLHFEDVWHSLEGGFYQGWDLHPAQLVTRYAAVYAFFLSGVDAAAARLANFVKKAAQATLVGSDFDDAATGQGLLNYFLRGINCGAVTEEETLAMTGLTLEELRGRSFVKILKNRI
jgi:citrate lyase beta subunit